MNKQLLLALIAIPMIAGCEANAESSSAGTETGLTVVRVEILTDDAYRDDDGELLDYGEVPGFSNATVISWEFCNFTDVPKNIPCIHHDAESPDGSPLHDIAQSFSTGGGPRITSGGILQVPRKVDNNLKIVGQRITLVH